MTKKYTRPVLRANVKALNVNSFTDLKTFAKALSPRAGRKSAQLAALENTIGSFRKVFVSYASTRENKNYLLSLLK